jgi:hypothetical protein
LRLSICGSRQRLLDLYGIGAMALGIDLAIDR